VNANLVVQMAQRPRLAVVPQPYIDLTRCLECSQVPHNHKRTCSNYGGPHTPNKDLEYCRDCKQANGIHARWCENYTGKRPLMPCCHRNEMQGHSGNCVRYTGTIKDSKPKVPKVCGCENHLGHLKSVFPGKNEADWWSSHRWNGMAEAYKCDGGNWHLSTRGTIRVRRSS